MEPSGLESSISISSNHGCEKTSMIQSERAKFFTTYQPQEFCLPDSIIFYIAKNPFLYKMYENIIQTCKYFFFKNPVLVFSNFVHYAKWHFFVKQRRINLSEITSKFWITDRLFVHSENSVTKKTMNQNILSSLMPKIYRCNVKYVTIANQIMSFRDLSLLVASAEYVSFNNITVKDETGKNVAVEKFVEAVFKAKEVAIWSNTFISSETMKELIKIPHFSKLDKFSLYQIPEAFDLETFYSYMKINAKIKYPEVITTTRPSTTKPNSTSEAALWLIIVLCILGVLLIVGLIILGVYFYKKRQTSKKMASPVEEPKQVTVVPSEVKETIEPPSKTRPDLNFTKFELGESRKSQKKAAVKKEATKEPTTTEEFVPTPPPKVTESAPPDPSKPEPKLPQGYYPFIPRIIPKSYKSFKTDSLGETIKKNKMTPVENVVESVRRNCIKDSDSKVVKEMKQKYPEVNRPLLPCEIKLLCVPVSKMFAEMNQMAGESEENLAALGVQFDSVHRIVIMTPEGRKYLQDPKTPSTVVYFAFGAEYHEVITDDMKVMPKLSMAHLFVIALQPRFEEYHRRKSLIWLRRDLPKIRGNYSGDERKAMPFPVNAIEKAFVLDSKYLLSLRGIDTDSEGDRKRMAEAKAKQKNNGAKNDDSKLKKKKPIKKRN